MAWETAERVQKNKSGEYRAFIEGEWVPVAQAQKNSKGEFRVMREATPAAAPTPEPASLVKPRPQEDQGLPTWANAALLGASIAAGPVLGTGIRLAAPAIATGVRAAGPALAQFGRSVQSGGFARGLSLPTRLTGAGTAGAVSGAVADPQDALESAGTGAALGAALPAVVRTGQRAVQAATRPSSRAPTEAQLREGASEAYKKAESVKAAVTPDEFVGLTNKLSETLQNANFLPALHTKVNRAVNAFTEQAQQGVDVSLERLDTLRRVAAKAAGSASKDESRIASAMIRDVDSFIRDSVPVAAAREIERARDLYARLSRSQKINTIIRDAKRSSEEFSVAIRKRFKKIADGDSKQVKLSQFKTAEQDLIKKIGKGQLDVGALEAVGTLAPPRIRGLNTMRGALQTVGYGAGAATLGAPATIAAGAVGFSSRALANRLAQQRAERIAEIARSGGVLPPGMAPQASQFGLEYMPQVLPGMAANSLSTEDIANQLGY
jgi:hypothetical protein